MRRMAVASRSISGHTPQRFEDAPAAVGQRGGAIVEARLPGGAERMRFDQRRRRDCSCGQRQRERRADQTAAADGDVDSTSAELWRGSGRSFISFSMRIRHLWPAPAVSTSLPSLGHGDVVLDAHADVPPALRARPCVPAGM